MSAILSPCGTYRYRLDRTVATCGRVYAFFGINPSTADANADDATVRKWIGFTKAWGGSRFIVGNVWPLRAADVKRLGRAIKWCDVERENWRHLQQMVAEADVLVPCWGDRRKAPRVMHNDIDQLLAWLHNSGKPVMTFGSTAGGDPKHPLMLSYKTQLGQLIPASVGERPDSAQPGAVLTPLIDGS